MPREEGHRGLITSAWEAALQWNRGGYEDELDEVLRRIMGVLETQL